MPRRLTVLPPLCNYYNLTHLKYSKDDDEEEERVSELHIHLNDGNPIRLSGVYSVGFKVDDVCCHLLGDMMGGGEHLPLNRSPKVKWSLRFKLDVISLCYTIRRYSPLNK